MPFYYLDTWASFFPFYDPFHAFNTMSTNFPLNKQKPCHVLRYLNVFLHVHSHFSEVQASINA
jgi:hypothetical protein